MKKTILYIILGLSIFIFLSWYFSNIFFYLVISGIIATILRPLTNYINGTQIFRVNIPRAVAVLVSFATFIGLIFLFISIFIPLIREQVDLLSDINYESLLMKISKPLENLEEFLIRYGIYEQPKGTLIMNIKDGITTFIKEGGAYDIGRVINNFFSVAGSVTIGIIAVFFITFFLLYEKGLFRRTILRLVPNKYFEVVITAFSKIEKLLSNYLIGLLVQMTAIFTIATIGLSVVGIKYAASIALFAAVANVIPYLGPILGAIFGIIVSISTLNMAGPNEILFMVIKILIVFAIVQLNDNLVFQPIIFSKSVKAHPLEIFIIIFVGATLGGIIGMIAAIPVYTVVRVSVAEFSKGFKQYQIFKT
ncbi:MAG: AI-2E family transporter [Cyclobacteriaceae bacterium]|nr:AI-2E family transporter [Cyclobacteriaceae bacterium]